jgi:hypothetical protein
MKTSFLHCVTIKRVGDEHPIRKNKYKFGIDGFWSVPLAAAYDHFLEVTLAVSLIRLFMQKVLCRMAIVGWNCIPRVFVSFIGGSINKNQ